MRYFFFSLLVLFSACSGSTPENLSEKVDQLIAQDNYAQALDVLEDAEPGETEANLDTLREKVHLNYGIYLEYRGGENEDMRERMTGALRQYIKVLKINPDNQKAISEIEQIMDIYGTMPDKSPGEEIVNDLQELGFDYK